jgi:hypothetical protein
MGIFSFKKKSAIPFQLINPAIFMPINSVYQFLSGGGVVDEQKFFNYYYQIPELQAVLNYRAKCKSSMKIKARNVKTGEDVTNPFEKLLLQPNILQSFEEFMRVQSINQDILGNSYIHMYFGTSPESTVSLWNIPGVGAEIVTPRNLNIFTSQKYSDIILKYKFKYNEHEITFEPDEIIHFADAMLLTDRPLTLKGESRVRPLCQNLENIKTTYEARGVIIGNSPLGMITNDSTDAIGTSPLDPKEKEAVQKAMKKYGAGMDKYQYIITASKLKFQSMSVNISDTHFKEVEEDLKVICNAFSFPVDLLRGQTTYENVKEAKKQLYQDSIIPESIDFLSGLSSALGLLDKNIQLYPDFSHIPALQTDYETKARTYNVMTMALSKALADQAITIEQYTEALEKIGMI